MNKNDGPPAGRQHAAAPHAQDAPCPEALSGDALVELAGRMSQVGGWSATLADGRVALSKEAAAIHELPAGAELDLEAMIEMRLPEHRPAMREAIRRCTQDGTPYDLELEILTAAGRRCWVRTLGQAARDASGRIVGLQGAHQDVSARKQVEQSLLETSERLSTTLESIHDCVITLDRDWRLTYLNRRAEQILRRSGADLLGRIVWDEFPDAEEFREQYERAVRDRRTVSFERHYAPLGIWFEINACPSPLGLTIYFRDITAHKRAEQQLAQLLASEQAARHEAEAARTLFRSAFESAPGLFLVVTPDDFSIVAASEAYLRATRTRRDQLIGRRKFEVFLPSPSAAAAQTVTNLRASFERVKALRRPDVMAVQNYPIERPPELGGGFEERYWSPINSPVFGPGGEVAYIIHRVEDVTEFIHYREHAQAGGQDASTLALRAEQMAADLMLRGQQLERLNEHLRAAQRMAQLGSWELGLDDGALQWSEETWNIFGARPDATGCTMQVFLDLVHPDDRALVLDARERALRGESPMTVNYRAVRPDGAVRHLHARAAVVADAAGRPRKLAGTVQDVTERRAADLRVQAQIRRLELLRELTRAIGERTDLPSILDTVSGRLQQELPLALCMFALHEAGTPHVRISGIHAGDPGLVERLGLHEGIELPLEADGLGSCLGGQAVYAENLASPSSSFNRRLANAGLASAVFAPLRVEDNTLGVLIAARGTAQAFSSEKLTFLCQLSEHVALAMRQAELHQALRTAYDDLRRTQQAVLHHERLRAIGQMASGIAHDINNAISPVALYTESLLHREQGLSPRGREQLQIIQLAIDDVAETVARLRESYREDAPDALKPVAVNTLVRQALVLTQARWRDMPQRAGVCIEAVADLQDDLPLVHAGDAEIREALTNLIFNAVDAMPEGGTLTLRTRTAGNPSAPTAVVVEVIDTGIGMNEETRRRSMEPFFTTKGERGTGLGLAMVYGIARRHRADIDIESAEGRGTCVRLRFPVAAPAASAPAEAEAPPDPPRRPLQVLVVDDEAAVVRALADLLQADGHRVTTVASGRDGIAAVEDAAERGRPFDIVITDLGMPNVDGREVAAAVKARAPGTSVAMLTGWGRHMASAGEWPANVDHLLAKPPSLKQLRAVLAQCGSA